MDTYASLGYDVTGCVVSTLEQDSLRMVDVYLSNLAIWMHREAIWKTMQSFARDTTFKRLSTR